MNFLTFTFFYIIILLSVIGYGYSFQLVLNKNLKNYSLGYTGLYGLFFLVIYSYISNIFFAHTPVHNIILLILGIFFFIFFIKKIFLSRNKFLIFLIIFSILFISNFIFKSHDDFVYYHFPYSYYLTQNSSIIGIGHLNHGFRTQSSIFYINSLLYFPTIKFYMFHLPAILILGFANIILLEKIYEYLKNNKINFILYFSLLSFLFINIFFYRIAEHGTDRSAQILIFILLIEILILVNFNIILGEQISKLLLIIALVISFKAFYILYLIFFLPVIYYLIKKKKILNSFKTLIFNKTFIFFSLALLLVLITNLMNTGCLVYPVNITCSNNFFWGIDLSQVNKMNNWYELWSKAGANPNFRIDNPEEYIKYFNWVGTWIDKYFFNKVSDFLLGTISLVAIIYFIFHSKNRNQNKREFLFIFIILLILLAEWFYNHPALRYGGYVLIASILFLICSLKLENFLVDKKTINKKITLLIVFALVVFISRNVNRIKNEIDMYNYKPFTEVFYKVDPQYFRIQNKIDKIIINSKNCKSYNNKCDLNLKPNVTNIFSKYIFYQ